MPQPKEQFEGLPALGPFDGDQVIRDLGNDLVLRRGAPEDAEAVASFNAVVHADPPSFEPARPVGQWTRELMDGRHPSCSASDFTIVQDTRSNRVASTLCLLSHRLRYGGVALDAGQPELVGTHPDYRHHGLVATQFEVIHDWSDKRGQRLQLVDGIPWYYRQFGYEMALEQSGHRLAPAASLQTRSADRREGLRVRPARVEDAEFLAELYERSTRRHRLACERDAAFWRYEIEARDAGSHHRKQLRVIERADGPRLAVFAHPSLLYGGWLHVNLAEVAAGVAWTEVLPTLLFAIENEAAALAKPGGKPFRGGAFMLGTEHPVYEAAGRRLVQKGPAYAFYVRVPDLAGFLGHVAPAIEARLAASSLSGHTGELHLSFYRSGVRIAFQAGSLTDVAPWTPATDERGDLAFPALTFLQLLFGYRSLSQLDSAFPDCVRWQEDQAPLVEALFPPQASELWLTL